MTAPTTVLRAARIAAGFTVEQVSQALGFTCRYVSALENGKGEEFSQLVQAIYQRAAPRAVQPDMEAMVALYGPAEISVLRTSAWKKGDTMTIGELRAHCEERIRISGPGAYIVVRQRGGAGMSVGMRSLWRKGPRGHTMQELPDGIVLVAYEVTDVLRALPTCPPVLPVQVRRS